MSYEECERCGADITNAEQPEICRPCLKQLIEERDRYEAVLGDVESLRKENERMRRVVVAGKRVIENTKANRWERAADEEFSAAIREWERQS